MFTDADVHQLILSILYSGVGIVVFAFAFFLMVKLAPFSVQKEIEEDQNVSLGIIIGCMMLGISIIIAATISSPSDSTQVAPDVPQEAAVPAPK